MVSIGVHRLVVGLLPIEPGAALGFRIDRGMLAFNTAVSVGAGVLFGVGPAMRASSLALSAVLGGSALGPTTPGGRGRFRVALTAQVAVSLVLSVAAVMFVRTLVSLLDVDAGFDRAHTLLVTIDPEECHLTPERMVELTQELAERVRALPGVQAAAIGMLEVSSMSGWTKTMWVEGHEYLPLENQATNFGVIGPGFFAATGIPLLAGRDVAAGDGRGAPPVAIINQSLAEKYFPHQSPLGRRLGDGPGPGGGRRSYEIVGVVGSAGTVACARAPRPTVFHPLGTGPPRSPVRPARSNAGSFRASCGRGARGRPKHRRTSGGAERANNGRAGDEPAAAGAHARGVVDALRDPRTRLSPASASTASPPIRWNGGRARSASVSL